MPDDSLAQVTSHHASGNRSMSRKGGSSPSFLWSTSIGANKKMGLEKGVSFVDFSPKLDCPLSHSLPRDANCKLLKVFTCDRPNFFNLQCNKIMRSSYKESRTILNFSQRCFLQDKFSFVTCWSQLAMQFCENDPIRTSRLLAGGFKLVAGERVLNTFQVALCKLRKNTVNA